MSQNTKILIGIAAVIVVIGAVLGIDQIRRMQQSAAVPELPAGAVPIHINGEMQYSLAPDDLEDLTGASFVDEEEGKTQEGWLLRDILLLYFDEGDMNDDSVISVSSSSRNKMVEMTWVEVSNEENMVMFDLSGKGTLKLVSQGLPQLDIRDEWVQDVDKIEVQP
jgi:hypothetical protein